MIDTVNDGPPSGRIAVSSTCLGSADLAMASV
ncbi:hypothetical protein MY4824_009463 [Beauveria thailandica]